MCSDLLCPGPLKVPTTGLVNIIFDVPALTSTSLSLWNKELDPT